MRPSLKALIAASAWLAFAAPGLALAATDPLSDPAVRRVRESFAIERMSLFDVIPSRSVRGAACADTAFPGLAWCATATTYESAEGGTYSRTFGYNVDAARRVVYLILTRREFPLARASFDETLKTLGARFGRPPATLTFQGKTAEGDEFHSLVAYWGGIKLVRLSDAELRAVAEGRNIGRGHLVDHRQDLRLSARQRDPVYRIEGGAGFIAELRSVTDVRTDYVLRAVYQPAFATDPAAKPEAAAAPPAPKYRDYPLDPVLAREILLVRIAEGRVAAIEDARRAEAERIAAEERARRDEAERKAAEALRAEEERKAAEERALREEAERKAAEERRIAEERRLAEEKARREAEERAATAERAQREEAERKAAEARRLAEQRARLEEAERKAAAERRAIEERARRAEAEYKASFERAQRAEAERRAAEERARQAESERRAAEERSRRIEAERKAAEARRGEERRLEDRSAADERSRRDLAERAAAQERRAAAERKTADARRPADDRPPALAPRPEPEREAATPAPAEPAPRPAEPKIADATPGVGTPGVGGPAPHGREGSRDEWLRMAIAQSRNSTTNWVFERVRDRISDEVVLRVRAIFSDEAPFALEIAFECNIDAGPRLKAYIRAFDKRTNAGLAIPPEDGRTGVVRGNVVLDEDAPQTAFLFPERDERQASIVELPLTHEDIRKNTSRPQAWLRHYRVALKFRVGQREAAATIYPYAENLRRVLEACGN